MSQPPPQCTAMQLRAVGATDTGRVRKHNEDVVLLREDQQLFIVCDGAGGHDAGDVAARLAATAVATYLDETSAERMSRPDFDRFGIPVAARFLARAVHEANRQVHTAAQQLAADRGMGSTMVVVLFVPATGQLHVAHVGDSRLYRLRGGHLEQLTRDHSLLNDVLEERPDVPDDVLAQLPRNVVTRALGMGAKVRPTIATFDALIGDRYLLCTDGLGGYVPSSTIASCLGDPRPAGAVCQLLLNAADDAGGRDNVGIVVIECLQALSASERARRRLQAEQQAASTRIAQASAPELLLMGIEELDVYKTVEALAGGDLPADDDHALLEAVIAEHNEE